MSFDKIAFLDIAISAGVRNASQARKMRDIMVDKILCGAVRDFVRGGFYTSSTDEAWLIPDFRKSAAVQAQAEAERGTASDRRRALRALLAEGRRSLDRLCQMLVATIQRAVPDAGIRRTDEAFEITLRLCT